MTGEFERIIAAYMISYNITVEQAVRQATVDYQIRLEAAVEAMKERCEQGGLDAVLEGLKA